MDNEYKIFELINLIANSSEDVGNEGNFLFSNQQTVETLKKKCDILTIKYDEASSINELILEIPEISIFKDFDTISRRLPEIIRTGKIKPFYCYYDKEESCIVILNTNNFVSSYYFTDDENMYTKDIQFEASNIYYWEKIYELFTQKTCDEISNSKSFTIHSYEKGKCTFDYTYYQREFNEINLFNVYSKCLSTIDRIQDYQMLFKNRCIERIDNKNNSAFSELISELDTICDKTIQDFEIFVSKINFDSYVEKYNEKISNIYSQARTIIEKILSNIYTIPLTYAGAIFALDKLNDESYNLFLYIAMICYTMLSCGFLMYELFDSKNLKNTLHKEIVFFTNNSQYLLSKTTKDTNAIKKRISCIHWLSVILILIFIGLLIYLGIKMFGTNIVDGVLNE